MLPNGAPGRLEHTAIVTRRQTVTRTTQTLDWGTGWAPVSDGSGLQGELDRELGARHPLSTAKPVVFGRCLTCDDVITRLTDSEDESELAVVHLMWSGRAEQVRTGQE